MATQTHRHQRVPRVRLRAGGDTAESKLTIKYILSMICCICLCTQYIFSRIVVIVDAWRYDGWRFSFFKAVVFRYRKVNQNKTTVTHYVLCSFLLLSWNSLSNRIWLLLPIACLTVQLQAAGIHTSQICASYVAFVRSRYPCHTFFAGILFLTAHAHF